MAIIRVAAAAGDEDRRCTRIGSFQPVPHEVRVVGGPQIVVRAEDYRMARIAGDDGDNSAVRPADDQHRQRAVDAPAGMPAVPRDVRIGPCADKNLGRPALAAACTMALTQASSSRAT